MLTLVHPGPETKPRLIAFESRVSTAIVQLRPGQPLLGQLFDALHRVGAHNGIAELVGGTFSPVSYCVPADGTSERKVSYSATRTTPRANLILGAATLGSRGGNPFMHSHCVWISPDGTLQAGHLWPETRIGQSPPAVVLHALQGVDLVSADDPETAMPVFTPQPGEDPTMPGNQRDHVGPNRSLIARVCPNEDITAAVKTLCASAGMRTASIRGGIGSLIGATFAGSGASGPVRVEGPGTEVATLVGLLTTNPAGEPEVTITCTLVDKYGQVHAGTLVAGENPVAVTFELLIQELNPISGELDLPAHQKEALA